MRAPITYVPKHILNADAALAALRDELQWVKHDDAPRHEYYCNDYPKHYTYGRGNGVRTYEPQPYHPVILEIRKSVEAFANSVFEVCFLNRYLNQRDQLGWHADDSPEMDDARPIAIVSLGVEREIWFRPNIKQDPQDPDPFRSWGDSPADTASIEKLKLGHGSLCLMAAGMQDEWQHRIPKASFQCGERISLTFRGYVSV
jgi:alkylated DNA repair dioxygenase AlkB